LLAKLSAVLHHENACLAHFGNLGPISPTFYEQLLRQNPFAKNLQTQIISTLKLCKKKLMYEKASRKILVN